MINTMTMMADFQPAVGMPACASAFHGFETKEAVSAPATCAKRRLVDGTTVSAYRGSNDVLVIKGAFPGTSAWSPPN